MVRLLGLAIHPDVSQILDPGPLHPSLGGCVAGLCTPYSAHWGGGAERSTFKEKLSSSGQLKLQHASGVELTLSNKTELEGVWAIPGIFYL